VAKAALAKGSRISGTQRTTLASEYAKRYSGGESIRKIAEDAGRSYGFVHNVLKESGVALRGRGGATRGATKKATSPSTAKKAASRTPTKRTSRATATKATTARKSSVKETAKKVATTAKAAAKKATGKTAAKKTPARTTTKKTAARS